jgi:hypothetical protein
MTTGCNGWQLIVPPSLFSVSHLMSFRDFQDYRHFNVNEHNGIKKMEDHVEPE